MRVTVSYQEKITYTHNTRAHGRRHLLRALTVTNHCINCSSIFSTTQNAHEHLIVAYRHDICVCDNSLYVTIKEIRSLSCPILACGVVATDLDALRWHLQSHLPLPRPDFVVQNGLEAEAGPLRHDGARSEHRCMGQPSRQRSWKYQKKKEQLLMRMLLMVVREQAQMAARLYNNFVAPSSSMVHLEAKAELKQFLKGAKGEAEVQVHPGVARGNRHVGRQQNATPGQGSRRPGGNGRGIARQKCPP